MVFPNKPAILFRSLCGPGRCPGSFRRICRGQLRGHRADDGPSATWWCDRSLRDSPHRPNRGTTWGNPKSMGKMREKCWKIWVDVFLTGAKPREWMEEWMGCWGLLGWLLLLWIIPENSLLFAPVRFLVPKWRLGGFHRFLWWGRRKKQTLAGTYWEVIVFHDGRNHYGNPVLKQPAGNDVAGFEQLHLTGRP